MFVKTGIVEKLNKVYKYFALFILTTMIANNNFASVNLKYSDTEIRYIFLFYDTVTGNESVVNLYDTLSKSINKSGKKELKSHFLNTNKKSKFVQTVEETLTELNASKAQQKLIVLCTYGHGSRKPVKRTLTLLQSIYDRNFNEGLRFEDDTLWDYEITRWYKKNQTINFLWINSACYSQGTGIAYGDSSYLNHLEAFSWGFKRQFNGFAEPVAEEQESFQNSTDKPREIGIQYVTKTDMTRIIGTPLNNQIMTIASTEEDNADHGSNVIQGISEYLKANDEITAYELFVRLGEEQTRYFFYIYNIKKIDLYLKAINQLKTK